MPATNTALSFPFRFTYFKFIYSLIILAVNSKTMLKNVLRRDTCALFLILVRKHLDSY